VHDVLGPGTVLGYCTNVHAGATFDQMRANLHEHALPVKQRVSPDKPMGVGLWLSAEAATDALNHRASLIELRDWMNDQGLTVFTINGFPYGNFHEPVVKTKVYEPDWTTPRRYEYTLTLAKVLTELLPDGAEGSISTLPIGWPVLMGNLPNAKAAAAANLFKLARELGRIESQTGKLIHIDLEPEPGCVIDTARKLVRFFERRLLLDTPDDDTVLRHLRICHDVCHSAVMFEPQAEAMATYGRAGLRVGKVQISSAVCARFDGASDDNRAAAIDQLKGFAEDRYQHQTSIRFEDDRTEFFKDLPEALASHGDQPAGEWRVHFHVPINLEAFGLLRTTRDDIAQCRRHLRRTPSHAQRHRRLPPGPRTRARVPPLRGRDLRLERAAR